MKHLRTFEGFFDFLKRDKNNIEIQIESILNRLKKVKKLKINPYKINYYNYYNNPDWIKNINGDKYTYEIIFDDITIATTKSEYLLPGGMGTSYYIFLKETDSDKTNVEPILDISNSIRKDFWKVSKNVYHDNKIKKQSDDIGNMINPAADLL